MATSFFLNYVGFRIKWYIYLGHFAYLVYLISGPTRAVCI